MVAKSKPVKPPKEKTTPNGKTKRGPSIRPTGRPPLLDDDIDGFELGWLIPTEKAVSSTEPLLVRAKPAVFDGKTGGWRGYLVNASAAEGEKFWADDVWSWGTPEQGSTLDESTGTMSVSSQAAQ